MAITRKTFMRYGAALAVASISKIKVGQAKPFCPPLPSHCDNKDEYWKAVRAMFPLADDWIYLNNSTLGPSPYQVVEATRAGMMEGDMYGRYSGYESVGLNLASFIGANENEIALTHNVTEGLNIACWGLPLKRGDEVIMSTHEHVGNAFPWLNRRKLHGIEIKVFEPASTAAETMNRIAALINSRTRVIATPHIPCTQGQVLPVKDICTLAREKGLFSIIDGAHSPGMIPLNLHDIGCDAYASCCHKWLLGPKGTGFLYVRKDFQETLQPYFVGGGGDNGIWDLTSIPIKGTDYANSAHRYFSGTQNLGLWKGVSAAISFMNTIGAENVHNRVKELGTYTQQQLLSLGNKIEMLTPVEDISRAGVTGFRIRKMEHDKFFTFCLNHKIRIRSVAENGLNSLRISTHIYNSKSDIDCLVGMVDMLG